MNGQLMEYWGRSMLAALQGQNQMGMMSTWFQRACQDLSRLNSSWLQAWGLPAAGVPRNDFQRQWEQSLEPLLQMQQMCLEWIGMVPRGEYEAQSKKIALLEEQLEDQARTIQKLQGLISKSGAGNSELIDQFQKLIDQQSRQFQQLTSSVGQYFKNSAEKAGTQK